MTGKKDEKDTGQESTESTGADEKTSTDGAVNPGTVQDPGNSGVVGVDPTE